MVPVLQPGPADRVFLDGLLPCLECLAGGASRAFSGSVRRIIWLLVAGMTACSNAANDDSDRLLGMLLSQGSWQIIPVAPGSFGMSLRSKSGSYSRDFAPSCSGRPGSSAGYAFLVKRGSSSNLLINFMGGGACWADANCLGPYPTYYYEVQSLLPATLAVASSILDAGVLNHNRAENPFRDWNMIFIPYCTGDIHIGSNDYTYSDPQTGAASLIRHRGFDNTLAVLKYLQTFFPEESVNRVFVTGQSAGAYGSIFNFPYIKEMYYSRQVDVLGDAGNGVLDVSDTGASATAFQSTSSSRWNAGVSTPSWIPTLAGQYLTLNIGEYFNRVATYYESGASTPAPGKSRLAQYTAAYDGNQRYFFNVMRLTLKNPAKSFTTADSMWGRSDGYDSQRLGGYPALNVNCNWNTQMRSLGTGAATTAYRRVIAPGSVHTISMSNSYYNQTIPTSTGTVRLVDWYNTMLYGSSAQWTNAVCVQGSCSAPRTEETNPSALNCNGQPGFSMAGDGW